MGDVRIRVRQRKDGQNVYEYSFEGLPIDGKRNIISKSGFKTNFPILCDYLQIFE